MIRFDGYYISDPVYFEDGIANYTYCGYSHNAYLFLENGQYLRATKNSHEKEVSFLRSGFDPYFVNKYMVYGNMLEIIFHTGEKWEFKESFEIVSSVEFKGNTRNLYWRKFENGVT
jgi:hypothetical protein